MFYLVQFFQIGVLALLAAAIFGLLVGRVGKNRVLGKLAGFAAGCAVIAWAATTWFDPQGWAVDATSTYIEMMGRQPPETVIPVRAEARAQNDTKRTFLEVEADASELQELLRTRKLTMEKLGSRMPKFPAPDGVPVWWPREACKNMQTFDDQVFFANPPQKISTFLPEPGPLAVVCPKERRGYFIRFDY